MRVEAGAVVDEFELPGIGQVVARHSRTRTPDGGVTWACMFTVVADGAADLAVVHRLSAPSLAEGRRSVRHAVEFMTGRAMVGPATVGPDKPDAPAVDAPAVKFNATNHPSRRATDRRRDDLRRDDASRVPRIPVFDLRGGLPGDAGPHDHIPAPLS